jgi:ADP-ribose pyrophosphatase
MAGKSAEQEQFEKTTPVKRQEIYKGRTITVRTDTLQKGEKTLKWDIVVHPGAVVLVPVTANQELVFVKQWRRALEKQMIELPAGTLEHQEPAADCAQRELREETGYRAGQIIPMGGFYSAPGFCTEYLHLFLALDLIPDPLPADDDEGIDLLLLSLDQVDEMIESGEICDAKTIAGVHRYAQWSAK